MAKIALVTGANQGIGYWLVRQLCKEHPDWIIYGTSRSVANGEAATQSLKTEGLTARYVELDITKPNTIKALRDKFAKEHGGIDVLVNNAGFAYKRRATESAATKVNVIMGINFFGTQMACEQFFPLLNDGARVAILSSSLAFTALRSVQTLNPERYNSYIKEDPPMDLQSVVQSMQDFVDSVNAGDFAEKGWAKDEAAFAGIQWSDDTAYNMSKLGCTLLARAYQQKFNTTEPERDIVVNAVDPGYVATNMTEHGGYLTPEQGADNVYCSTALPSQTSIRGQYISDKKAAAWR